MSDTYLKVILVSAVGGLYMIAQGVNPGQIHTVSYGEERPFCFGGEECRKTNRRVHVRFLK